MLSEHQHFCLDAMGLSHGLAPKKRVLPTPTIAPVQHSAPVHNNTISSETKTPQSIKRLMPNIVVPKTTSKPAPAKLQGVAPEDIKGLDNWADLKSAVENCQYCQELAKTRSQTLFGSGNEQAELLIISEAPSNDEDIQGLPFVGKAGELLDNMLLSIGIKRDAIYLTNIIKCQPPNNRDPHKDESKACSSFLQAQINLIKPKLILALGRIAAHNLLDNKTPVGQLRGSLHQHLASKTDLIISYHPAYLLRNPSKKAQSWEDLKQVHQLLTKPND